MTTIRDNDLGLGERFDSADPDDHIYARVVADSITEDGVRLTTFEKRHHRWVLAEDNTHATPAKNSASSRARPIGKVIDDVRQHPAVPVVWASEQKGMSGGGPIPDEAAAIARRKWDLHREATIALGFELRELGVHKSITNRLIEPHSMHVSVWTATALENYFDQRYHPEAQPEIQVVAERMHAARDASTPRLVRDGEWHLPYIGDEDREQVAAVTSRKQTNDPLSVTVHRIGPQVTLARISAARVARTSYLTQDGKRDLAVDLTLYGRLAEDRFAEKQPPHWSPLEQVATPCADNRQSWPLMLPTLPGINDGNVRNRMYPTTHLPKVGKFVGWVSMRHLVEAQREMTTFR